MHTSNIVPGAVGRGALVHLQQQQHQKLYLHDHKGITVLQKLLNSSPHSIVLV